MPRLELRVSEEWLAAVDVARGGLPRGTWVKGAVEKALGDGGVAAAPVRSSSASSRSSRVEQGDGPVERPQSSQGARRPPAESKRATVRPSVADMWRR